MFASAADIVRVEEFEVFTYSLPLRKIFRKRTRIHILYLEY